MSGATGVLAWLDSLHETTADGAATNRKWSEAQEARATVAELVAADKAYDAAKASRTEADNRITHGDRSDDAFVGQANAHHAYDRAVERRRAALAAFRGEA